MPPKLTPAFESTYEKLLQGLNVQQVTCQQGSFWATLLLLSVDRQWLTSKFEAIPREDCLGYLLPFLNQLFEQSVKYLDSNDPEDPKRWNALETMLVFVRCILRKRFAGWEVMEICAGEVSRSDEVFTQFAAATLKVIGSQNLPASRRHRAVELSLMFMCSIDQSSPGAYLLRMDFFHTVCQFVRETNGVGAHTSMILLSSLANYHRSDAAQLNPYLRHMANIEDDTIVGRMLAVCQMDSEKVIRSYQDIVDDRAPTLISQLNNFMTSLRPDKVLASSPIDVPSEMFASLPTPCAIFLVPLYDIYCYNQVFRHASLEAESTFKIATMLSMSSYVLTHAWSSTSKRASTYARLTLNILLVAVEDPVVFNHLSSTKVSNLQVCRQRRPSLPLTRTSRPLISGVLDSCVLFLRHNLHKDIDGWAYLTCIFIVDRIIDGLAVQRLKLEYTWHELWRSLLSVLQFLSSKTDKFYLQHKSEVQEQVFAVLIHAIRKWELFLPGLDSISELMFEIMRCSPLFSETASTTPRLKTTLVDFSGMSEYYGKRVQDSSHVRNADQILGLIKREIDRDGLHGVSGVSLDDESDLYASCYRETLRADKPLQETTTEYSYPDGIQQIIIHGWN